MTEQGGSTSAPPTAARRARPRRRRRRAARPSRRPQPLPSRDLVSARESFLVRAECPYLRGERDPAPCSAAARGHRGAAPKGPGPRRAEILRRGLRRGCRKKIRPFAYLKMFVLEIPESRGRTKSTQNRAQDLQESPTNSRSVQTLN